MPTPTTKASGEKNVGDATLRAASSVPVSNLLEILSIFSPIYAQSKLLHALGRPLFSAPSC
jgi:hypothetical protein